MAGQMRYLKTSRVWLATIGTATTLVCGCATNVETQEFRRNPDSTVEASYVATDADFSRFDRLMGADMGIFFPESTNIPADDLARIRTIFRSSFLSELDAYEVVENAGQGVMLVDASLIDLRTAGQMDIPSLRREIQDVARQGSLVFLMELKDSETGRVLARAADSSLNPNIGSDDIDETEWGEVERAAAHWASLFRQFLDQNFDK